MIKETGVSAQSSSGIEKFFGSDEEFKRPRVLAITFSILYIIRVSVGDTEHYAISIGKIPSAAGTAYVEDAWL
jgi:hypothetical protein